MDYVGTVLKTDNGVLRLREYTFGEDPDMWDMFPDWRPEGAYGYQLDILASELNSSPWLYQWMLDNGFKQTAFTGPLHTRAQWVSFETRQDHLRLKDLLVYCKTFVLQYHVDGTSIFIGKRAGCLWVEEMRGAGMWKSYDEMFYY
jgi:hypothetical protein